MIVVSAVVCICSDGTENAANNTYRSSEIPTDKWTAQQLRETTPWGQGPKYLIRDRDKKYARHFTAVAGSIKEVKTPYRTPKANGVCERFMGSLRRECMDHILIHDEKHLQRVVKEYTSYFNQERPHQGIDQRIPEHYELAKVKANQRTVEGWFSLLKRGVMGTFHHVSEEHLDRYVDEFAFRYNRRDLTDAERAFQAIKKVGGKRLTYKKSEKRS